MSSGLHECCGQMMRGRRNVGYMRVTPPTGIVYSCEGVKGLRNVTWIYIMGSIFFFSEGTAEEYTFSCQCRFRKRGGYHVKAKQS